MEIWNALGNNSWRPFAPAGSSTSITPGGILVQQASAHQRIDYGLCLQQHTVVAMIHSFPCHKNNETISPFLTFFWDLLHCLAPPTWESAGGRLWCDGRVAQPLENYKSNLSSKDTGEQQVLNWFFLLVTKRAGCWMRSPLLASRYAVQQQLRKASQIT
jgi:hypothetical protein